MIIQMFQFKNSLRLSFENFSFHEYHDAFTFNYSIASLQFVFLKSFFFSSHVFYHKIEIDSKTSNVFCFVIQKLKNLLIRDLRIAMILIN